MAGNHGPPVDQVLDLIDVVSQIASELPASESRQELVGALAIALLAAMRLNAEYRAARRRARRA